MSPREQANQNSGPGVGAPDRGDAPKADYQVGYQRPPLHTRFKPGQSGNKNGRPKGRPNHRTTLNRVMNEKVTLREGEKTRRVTKFEAMLQAQASKGMKGDTRSAGIVINLMGKTGLLGDHDDAIKAENPQTNPDSMQEIIEPRLGDCLFADINGELLAEDERIELARFAAGLDELGIAWLCSSDLERIKELIKKGKGEDRAAA
jgi:Family of unknown function (DUF5681)